MLLDLERKESKRRLGSLQRECRAPKRREHLANHDQLEDIRLRSSDAEKKGSNSTKEVIESKKQRIEKLLKKVERNFHAFDFIKRRRL